MSVSSSREAETGLRSTACNGSPAASASSCSRSNAVTITTTGGSRSTCSSTRSRIHRTTSSPLIVGIRQSSSTRSNGRCGAVLDGSNRAIASAPELASTASTLQEARISTSIWRELSTSSTTSARRPRIGKSSCARSRRAPTGSSTSKCMVLPRPSSLSTVRAPPINATRRWLSTSPRPVPPKRRAIEPSAWVNGEKSRSWSSAEMPMPVSSIANFKRALDDVTAGSPVTLSRTCPASVNFTALPTRLFRIWPSRSGSPTSVAGRPGSTPRTSSKPLLSAPSAKRSMTFSSSSSRSNSVCSSDTRSASSLE